MHVGLVHGVVVSVVAFAAYYLFSSFSRLHVYCSGLLDIPHWRQSRIRGAVLHRNVEQKALPNEIKYHCFGDMLFPPANLFMQDHHAARC